MFCKNSMFQGSYVLQGRILRLHDEILDRSTVIIHTRFYVISFNHIAKKMKSGAYQMMRKALWSITCLLPQFDNYA